MSKKTIFTPKSIYAAPRSKSLFRVFSYQVHEEYVMFIFDMVASEAHKVELYKIIMFYLDTYDTGIEVVEKANIGKFFCYGLQLVEGFREICDEIVTDVHERMKNDEFVE